jgi:diguanylate cyclase (GGDEF)-like protein
MIVVPLRHQNATVGVLKVLAAKPAAFESSDLRLLGLMADFIAASMFHATHNESGGLFHLATHDAMTGLANRALFYDRLRHCLALAERERRQFAVLNFDMDGLKPINDRMGHRAGDAAIQEFAQRLKLATRASDTVARLGGDEFGAILSRVDQADGAMIHMQRLADKFAQPFQFEGRPIPLRASIGCAMYPDHGVDINTLIEHADQAMYSAKRAAKDQQEPD